MIPPTVCCCSGNVFSIRKPTYLLCCLYACRIYSHTMLPQHALNMTPHTLCDIYVPNLCTILRQLPWVLHDIILPHIVLLSFFRDLVLNKHLLYMLCHEISSKFGIPEFACDTEVFATSPQSGGLAALHGGRDAFWREIVLFTSRNGDKSTLRTLISQYRIFP